MSVSDPADRRATFRAPISTAVVVVDADGREQQGLTLNVSLGGCAFVVPSPLEVDAEIMLQMTLGDRDLSTRAQVRHWRSTVNGFVVGCRFAPLGSAAERLVAGAVTAQDRRTSVRANVAISLEYRRVIANEPFRLTASTDIARGGIRFALVSGVELGDRLQLLVMFEGDRIPLEGTVVRLIADADQRHAAVAFDEARCPRLGEWQAAVGRFLDSHPHVIG